VTLIVPTPRPRPTYLAKLNVAQCRAVEHGINASCSTAPPLLVIAGAGSGKTRTLAHRVGHLIAHGVDPNRIMSLTFSRRAAAEMARQVALIAPRVLGRRACLMTDGLPWSGTFHAIGARLLRDHADAVGLNPAFTIHDRDDSADFINLIRNDLGLSNLGLSNSGGRFPAKATCLSIYSHCVNAQRSLEETLRLFFPWNLGWVAELRQLFAGYVEAKQRQNLLDYDDLLLYWAQAVSDEALAKHMGGRFDHILVDEYQDTNRLQSSILLGLKPNGHGLTVVGDDAQSIYSFRSATVRNILDFPKHFQPAAAVITLDRNYRSSQPLLAAANGVIDLAAERFTKNLWTDRDGDQRPRLVSVKDQVDAARYIATTILESCEAGAPLKQQAVLFRTSRHSALLEVELTRRNIPFKKFGGLKFMDAAHIKDLLALLRFIENPRDRVSGLRLLLLIPGVGPANAQRMLHHIDATTDSLHALANMPAMERPGRDWNSFIATLAEARSACWPAEFTIARDWYDSLLDRIHDHVDSRRADLIELEQIASSYPSRTRFLTELALDPVEAVSARADSPSLDDDRLILSTIHSAKGQEWNSVFVLNVVEGCIPSDLATHSLAELEEERRLLYVAMTRAKDDLHLIIPRRHFSQAQQPREERHLCTARTRFIPDQLLPLFDQIAWPLPTSDERIRESAGIVNRVDAGARARGMWR
jgi:DNA helicase-2/ATP-dependent DNA helicase PcrA